MNSTEQKSPSAINASKVLGAAAVIGVLIVLGAIWWSVNNTANDLDVASCRSLYRADIDDAGGRADALVMRGLAALTEDDQAEMQRLIMQVAPTVKAIERANDRYRVVGELAIRDREAFLVQCRKDFA